jgi:hypothetical protein
LLIDISSHREKFLALKNVRHASIANRSWIDIASFPVQGSSKELVVVRRNTMKKKLIYLFPALIAILVAGVSKAQAQINDELKATIPFEFHAGGATLPPGNYTVEEVQDSQFNLIEIKSDDSRSVALLQTIGVQPRSLLKNSELLFDHTGGDYYLARIFDEDDDSGVAVMDAEYAKKYGAALPAVDFEHIAVAYKSK